MGLFDAILGRRKLRGPAEKDRLFAMSTAAVAFEAEQGIVSAGSGALVFKALPTADFEQLARDMEEIVRGAGDETGTSVRRHEDNQGFSWMILEDPDVEDVVVGMNAVSVELQGGGYGERLLCGVFAFRDSAGRPLYWIYSFKRGTFWPFVPGPTGRDNEYELRLSAQAATELPVEPDLERWLALYDLPI